jgi:thiol-disulfide isomerase/thioredoxin
MTTTHVHSILRLMLVAVLVLAAVPSRAAEGTHVHASTEEAEHGPCLVCAVLHGEAEDEPVRAKRMHEGKEYGFCSAKCAQEFAADPEAFLPPVFPRQAPGFALTTLAGQPVSLDSLRGGVTLLDFWATWCAPCRKSMPELQTLHERYASKGFRVLGVSIDEKADAKVRKYVAAQKYTYPIAIDAAKAPAWQRYRVKSVPAAFLLDAEGRIVAQWTGRSPVASEVEAQVKTLLGLD